VIESTTVRSMTYVHVDISKVSIVSLLSRHQRVYELIFTVQYEAFIKELAAYVKGHEPGCVEYRWKKLPAQDDGTQTYLFFET
jgi:hypothetical protein